MEYTGKLYGKVGNSFFPLQMTSVEVDKLQADKDKLAEILQKLVHDYNQSGKTAIEIKAALKDCGYKTK